MTKTCTKCGEAKPLEAFGVKRSAPDGRRARCRPCRSAVDRERYRENLEASRAAARERTRRYRRRHPDRVRESNRRMRTERAEMVARCKRRWNENNPDRVRAHGERRRRSPQYRLEAAIRSGVHRGLTRGSKNGRGTFAVLGYSLHELRQHIERHFEPGMTWANYGEWHIDHVVPLSAFNYSKPEHPDFRRAWALSNLRPLWAPENLSKNNKLGRPFQPFLQLEVA